MEVSGQLHAPSALPPGKDPPMHIGQEAVWDPRTGLDAVATSKTPAFARNRTPVV